jgi:hypothetical protein
MNVFHTANRQDVTCGLAREFIGAVAGANGNRQRIQLGGLYEVSGLLRIGQHIRHFELANGSNAILFTGLTRF